MTSCRSNLDGQGTAGVCNTTSGYCEECFITSYDDGATYVDNCPGAYNRCIADDDPDVNPVAGAYC